MPEKKKTEFTFTHDGQEYTLPSASAAALRVPGKYMQDAIMDVDQHAELRLRFAMLDASGASEEARAALREMPAEDMYRTVLDWMGESPASSS